jgi:3-methylcrotonyl-CoA carboxylase beta subunit
MSVLESHVDPASPEFRDNAAHMDQLIGELGERLRAARAGGGEEAVRRHREQGKLLVRTDREASIPARRSWRIGALAAFGLYDGQAPARLVCGIGRVSGREVMIVANDATVKGGTYFPITVREAPARRRSPWRTACRASTWSTREGRSRRCRPRCSRTATTSAASSTTRRA